MLHRGEIVRLPHGRGNGVVIDCSTDGSVRVYVGARPIGPVLVHTPTPHVIEPIVEEYVECELIPTGRRVAQVARRHQPPHYRRRHADADTGD